MAMAANIIFSDIPVILEKAIGRNGSEKVEISESFTNLIPWRFLTERLITLFEKDRHLTWVSAKHKTTSNTVFHWWLKYLKLITVSTEHLRFSYIEHATSGHTNPSQVRRKMYELLGLETKYFHTECDKERDETKWAPSSEFVSSSIPSWQILTAHAQPFRGARDLAFRLKVPLDSLLIWASSGGSGETARMRRLAWTFAARIGDKYQIRLARPKCLFNLITSLPFTLVLRVGFGLWIVANCGNLCTSIDSTDLWRWQ